MFDVIAMSGLMVLAVVMITLIIGMLVSKDDEVKGACFLGAGITLLVWVVLLGHLLDYYKNQPPDNQKTEQVEKAGEGN